MSMNKFSREANRGLRAMMLPSAFEPPRLDRSIIPTGPRAISDLQRTVRLGGGPGPAPPEYTGGTVSVSEWYIAWALMQIFKDLPGGGRDITWSYQSSYLGGRHIPGGAVVDFIIFGELWNYGLRIQTFRFHFDPGAMKVASDFDQKVSLEDGGLRIIDIYEQDYINDETGRAAIKVVLEALQGIERMNPRSGGQVVDR